MLGVCFWRHLLSFSEKGVQPSIKIELSPQTSPRKPKIRAPQARVEVKPRNSGKYSVTISPGVSNQSKTQEKPKSRESHVVVKQKVEQEQDTTSPKFEWTSRVCHKKLSLHCSLEPDVIGCEHRKVRHVTKIFHKCSYERIPRFKSS